MSLLDDVSIVVTPNGYKAGELYAVIPVPSEGADVVEDGDFPLPNVNWSLGGGAEVTVDGLRINNTVITGNAYAIQTLLVSTSSKQFVLTYDVIITNGEDLFLEQASGLVLNTSTTGVNRKLYFTWDKVDSKVTIKRINAGTDVTIDNVILQELTSADMDVTRATAATRVDENGLIEDVLSNVPRIDYTGGGCPHILAEPMRTNQFVQSNNFNTSWTQTSVDVETDVITSPISGELADSVTATTTTAQHRVLQTPASTGVGTFTMYIKQGELSRICVHFLGTNKAVGFDCSDNTTFAAAGIASYPTRYTISDFGNGWSKVEMYDVGSTTRVDIYIANPTVGGNNAIWTGDGTSKIYFAAAQFELGSYPTSYIPTSGSTVTRNQDVFTRDGIGSLINSTEGVLFIEMAALSDDLTYRRISLSDSTEYNRIIISYDDVSNTISGQVFVGGVEQSLLTYVLSDITEFSKIALKYKVNDFELWVDGYEIATGVSGSVFTDGTLNSLSFDNGSSVQNFFGKVKQLQVYKTALTDDTLALLTS